jgi:phosphoribosyl 1,2-cyclic phosphodiesterase
MKIKVWGARGSIPAPGPETTRYGGNTSCVEVTMADGSTLILDAGTGIRNLGLALPPSAHTIHILLTHLHLDHIQGLLFFAPLFDPDTEVVVWGPPSPDASLLDRVARYISAPLAPIEVRELPAVSFREAEPDDWELGSARIRAHAVIHRGPTLGYRIEGDGASLCYIPDHEPGLGRPLSALDDDWISGFGLAQEASLLIHDCQYTDAEYPDHLGWGHSPLSDTLEFAHRTVVERLLLFHHDPLHTDDFLDSFRAEARSRWRHLGGDEHQLGVAGERREVIVGTHDAGADASANGTPIPPGRQQASSAR